MSYFWTDFASLEALTHNPVRRVAIALIHLNIKRIGDDSLFDGQQTLMNNDSQVYLLYFMWLVSSHFVEIKRKASDVQPAQIWAEIFEANQTSFISAVNSPKEKSLSFLYMLHLPVPSLCCCTQHAHNWDKWHCRCSVNFDPPLPYFCLCRELWVRIAKKSLAISRAGQVWVLELNKVRIWRFCSKPETKWILCLTCQKQECSSSYWICCESEYFYMSVNI